MPYASDKQKHFMQAVAHSPSFSKKVGVPQSVGKKFEQHKNDNNSRAKANALRRRGY